MSSLDSSLTWKFLGVGVTYPVLPIYCGYELVDERVRSRAFILHFRLEVLDQLLVSWIELNAGRQPHPILLAVTAINPIRKGCTKYHSTDAREGVQLCAHPDRTKGKTKLSASHIHAYRLAVDFLAAVGAVLGGGDPVFLELLVDELRGAAAVAPIHV